MSLPDYVQTDQHLLHAAGLEEMSSQLFIDENTLVDLDIPIYRHNKDMVIDRSGKKLLELCKSTGLLIVNSRVGKKEKSNSFTCKG